MTGFYGKDFIDVSEVALSFSFTFKGFESSIIWLFPPRGTLIGPHLPYFFLCVLILSWTSGFQCLNRQIMPYILHS